ncbi:hypothetical protein AC578_8208 [Pseudocercospora eumusae]|uniref:Uncharacterized protein n=1 Tax=Pseudocercospora eumusae TaxID=321146 RepID=A0A139HEV9_9PEZI|nr:hypothetical protein AC578_8208 [Pseudocercospora eumusae]
MLLDDAEFMTTELMMSTALTNLLEAPIYHGYMYLLMRNTPPAKFWLKCIEAKYEGKGKIHGREEFDEGLGKFTSFTDLPSSFLWREPIDAYPEAKVVLVNRDYEA